MAERASGIAEFWGQRLQPPSIDDGGFSLWGLAAGMVSGAASDMAIRRAWDAASATRNYARTG
eukprot:scaffold235161_cov14-Tisochrysis_lutea.AAC.1